MVNPADVITLDFETFAIQDRPRYPPEPVGLAIKFGFEPSRYLAFGHPTGGNNATREQVRSILGHVIDSGRPILCHNAGYDMAVLHERLGVPMPPWQQVHDTLFLLFLCDPHALKHDLKSGAEKHLGLPPTERDEVHEWLWDNRQSLRATYGPDTVPAAKSQLGAAIAYAPADLVGRYACGDVDRTHALFARLYPDVAATGMGEAYDVERETLYVFMDASRRGIRVDREAIARDIQIAEAGIARADEWLRTRLNAPSLTLSNLNEVAEVFEREGVVLADRAQTTAGGRLSLAKDNFPKSAAADPEVWQYWTYRGRQEKLLATFLRPWLAKSEATGRVYPSWHQTRGEDGGTRTGRPSSSNPNFLNLAKDLEAKKDGFKKPEGLPDLVQVRRYVLPEEGHVLIGRDFNGQELRVFAHFERGDLFDQYAAAPALDVHAYVGGKIAEVTGDEAWRAKDARGKVKILNFQALYGGGAPAAAAALEISLADAKVFKAMHDEALPGRRRVQQALEDTCFEHLFFRTLGGRLYNEPPPRFENGQRRSTAYKMLNILVQGSAADMTKRAVLRWNARRSPRALFLLQVYDEVVLSVPYTEWREHMAVLREAMEYPWIDVAILTDGEVGWNWGEMVEEDEI